MRKVKGGLKTKGSRVSPYDKKKNLENMSESSKFAPMHMEGSKKVQCGHVYPGAEGSAQGSSEAKDSE